MRARRRFAPGRLPPVEYDTSVSVEWRANLSCHDRGVSFAGHKRQLRWEHRAGRRRAPPDGAKNKSRAIKERAGTGGFQLLIRPPAPVLRAPFCPAEM